jgi:hypothetical protein
MTKEETKSGLGVQKTWGDHENKELPHAFAIHYKKELTGKMKDQFIQCQVRLGCFAYYDESGHFQLGCNRSKAITDF